MTARADLVVDACALLHAKQLHAAPGSRGIGGLGILEQIAARGVLVHTSKGVHGELVAMSLSSVIASWSDRGWITIHGVGAQEVRTVRNVIRGRDKVPGKRDLALIALADRLPATLLTHDDAAAVVARKLGVHVVDLLDLGHLLWANESLTDQSFDDTFEAWNASAWRPHDWKGSASATVGSRPGSDRLIARLQSWLAERPEQLSLGTETEELEATRETVALAEPDPDGDP